MSLRFLLIISQLSATLPKRCSVLGWYSAEIMLHFRRYVSSVYVQVRTVQYCVDMIQTFALADRAILKIIILSYADASLSCDAYVFIPINGHWM